VTLELGVALLGTAFLAWAAVTDARTRKVPVAAGLGILGLGLVVLVWDGWYLAALYYLLAIWSTRGGVWRYMLVAASLVMLWMYQWEAVPLVVGVLFVALLFWRKWFGGGDAQLAIGLIGIGHDWMVLGLLFGLTILVALALTVIRQGGVVQGVKRMAWVASHMGEPPGEEAIRTPWAVVAAIAGVGYLWLWALVL
jgi:hypothetical protein